MGDKRWEGFSVGFEDKISTLNKQSQTLENAENEHNQQQMH